MSTPRKNYVRPLDVKHGSVDLSHGGGGRAMAQLVGELFERAFDNEWLAQHNDQALLPRPAGAHRHVHRLPRRVAAVLPGRRHRLPVGARHDQRRGHVGRGAAVPGSRLHPRRRLCAGRSETHRRFDGRRGARGRRAHRHRRHQGGGKGQGRRRVHHHHRRRRGAAGHRDLRRPRAAGRPHPRVRHARRPWHGGDVGARGAGLRHGPQVRHGGAARPGGGDARRRARRARAARPDTRRAGHHAERDRCAVGRGHADRRGGAAGAAPGGGGLRIPRAGPAVRGQRRQAGGHRCRPNRPKRCWRRCARTRWAATPR